MNKAQQMLAKAGFPDTAAGKAAFHKQYPTPDSFFQVHGDQYKNGGPVMYGNGTKVYSTFDQNTKQVGNNYASNITDASTNIDPNGNTSQQYTRQTTDPNSTPYMRYFNDNELGSEMHIVGPNSNMFVTPDPMMDNFLKTRTNYMSGAMAGEQMKRNGGMIKYDDGGMVDENTVDENQLTDSMFDFNRPPRKRRSHRRKPTCVDGRCFSFEDGGTVDALQLMGMPTPPMYGMGGPYIPTIDESLEGMNQGNPMFNSNAPKNDSPVNLIQRKPTNTINYNIDYKNNLNPVGPSKGLNINAGYTHNFGNGWNVNAGGTYGVTSNMSEQTGSPITNQTWNANVGGGYTGKNANFKANVGYDSKQGIVGTAGGTFNFGARREDGGSVPHMYNVGGFTNPDEPTNPNDMSLFSMTYGKPNRYFETKQEGDKYSVQQRGDFPLSNQQFKNWNSPSATFSSPNQLNEWHNIGANEYNKLNSQAVNGKIGYQTYAQGGHIDHYIPSYNFGHVQSDNNTYRHGYANGGPIGKYDFGSTIKDIGYGIADSSLGSIGTLTGIKSMQDIVDEDQYSNDKFDDVANTAGKVAGTVVKVIPGIGPVVTAVGAGAGALANTAFKIDERNYDPSQHTSNWDKAGNFVEGIGNIASSVVNPMGATNTIGAADTLSKGAQTANTLSKGAKTAMNIGNIAGLGATAIKAGQDIDKSQGGTYDPTNLLNLGMGVARSGFFGGNTNTSNNFTNTKGAVDYTPTMDTPLYAAMGGAVNAPNMMQYGHGGRTMLPPNVSTGRGIVNRYDAGSTVNNADNLSPKDQYNLFLNAKPVTKYFSNAFPAHPKDGSMDPRGTVTGSVDPQTGEPIEINVEANEANWRLPNKTNFITTKKDTEKIIAFDKNNDDIAKASAMANIARAKLIKDAKAKAQQEQMMQQQDMMSAQYGGMVGQYGYGGGVMKYDGGSWTPYTPLTHYTAPYSAPGGPYSSTGQSPINSPSINLNSSFANNYAWNSPSGTFDPSIDSMELMQTKPAQLLPVNEYNEEPKRSETVFPLNPPRLDYEDYGYNERSSNKMGIYDYMRFAPAAWNAIQALKKPSKVPSDLGNVDTNVEMPRLSSYSAEQAIDAMDAKDKYLARQAGTGSNYLAFLTAMNNQKSLNKAKVIEGYRNAQAGLDAEGVKLKKSLQAQNAGAATQRYMLQAQADAVPIEYASKAMANLGEIGNTNYTYNKAYPMFEMMYPEYAAKLKANKMRNKDGKTKTDEKH